MLSTSAIEIGNKFVTWFTEVMLDQLTFMTGLFEVDRLTERLATLVTRDLGLADAALRSPRKSCAGQAGGLSR